MAGPLAAVAFENLFIAVRDNELRQLRREEAFETADAAQFLDLFGDPRFETAVQLCYLIGAFVQFADQPRVLHCDNRLRRKVLQQRDLFLRERPSLAPVGSKIAEQIPIISERHEENGANTRLYRGAIDRIIRSRSL